MADINVKDIKLKAIDSKTANSFVKKYHYSGKVVSLSQLHFGAFYNNKLHGVMSYGPPMDKRKVIGLVSDTKWNGMIELNRMAFDDYLPKNSESRCIAVSIRLIKKHAPQVKWILSYSDATQCGDGTIYRASGFKLTAVKKNNTMQRLKSGEVVAKRGDTKRDFTGAEKLEGFQNRYIYIIDKNARLTVPELPFNEIDKANAGMYKGKKVTLAERTVT